MQHAGRQTQVACRVVERHDSEATKQVVCKLRQMQGVLCSAYAFVNMYCRTNNAGTRFSVALPSSVMTWYSREGGRSH